MARPRKEGMDYFPHDVDASSDKKIEALRALYGNDGYVFYFIMLEEIYKEADFQLDVSDAETKEEMFQILAKKIQIPVSKFKEILQTAFRWGVFNKKTYDEEGAITSNGIQKRAAVVVDKRVKMRRKYQQEKEEVSDAETTPETPQSKSKSKSKSKVKEKKKSTPKIKFHDYVTMTKEEHQKLLDRYGKRTTNRYIETLGNYKGSKGKKYKSDYLTILSWIRREEDEKGVSLEIKKMPADIDEFAEDLERRLGEDNDD